MTQDARLGRYRLLELISEDAGGVALWHAYDEILDRPVSIRVVPLSHPRADDVLAAAQRAALVDDRRLLRVLDLIDVPAGNTRPAGNGVVSEWATGRDLTALLAARHGTPLGAPEALDLVADVARAIAAGASQGIGHGRLRPSSVFLTDAGEVRVRGLAVDAAVLGRGALSDGAPAPSMAAADVDGLGCLTYLLTTGYWPGMAMAGLPEAPRSGGGVLPPTQVRAAVPGGLDTLIHRSVAAAALPRGMERLDSAAGFAAAAGATLDHVAPVVTTTLKPVQVGPDSTGRRAMRLGARLLVVALATVLVAGIGWMGWQLLSAAPPDRTAADQALAEILVAPAVPVDELEVAGIDQPFPIAAVRSYDPYGDDDANERPDRRKGLENDELAVTVNDTDPDTAWLTSVYDTADLDGKGGVGLILDLGTEQQVQQVSANLIGKGTGIDVRVSDAIQRDPALWTPLGSAFAPSDRVDVRAPRPVPGRYVLLWFTQLPPVMDGSGFQGGLRSVVVTG